MYECVRVYLHMYSCMGLLIELSDMRRAFLMMFLSYAERRGWFSIIWLFVSVQIKDMNIERRG